MKKIIFCLTFLFAFTYNSILSQTPKPPNDDGWKLNMEESKEMKDRLKECGIFKKCRNAVITDGSTNAVYNWIKATYGSTAYITLEDARYRNADEKRYGTQRGIKDEKKFDVNGFKTKIVKVVMRYANSGALIVPLYFDCFTICPPPENGPCPAADPPTEITSVK